MDPSSSVGKAQTKIDAIFEQDQNLSQQKTESELTSIITSIKKGDKRGLLINYTINKIKDCKNLKSSDISEKINALAKHSTLTKADKSLNKSSIYFYSSLMEYHDKQESLISELSNLTNSFSDSEDGSFFEKLSSSKISYIEQEAIIINSTKRKEKMEIFDQDLKEKINNLENKINILFEFSEKFEKSENDEEKKELKKAYRERSKELSILIDGSEKKLDSFIKPLNKISCKDFIFYQESELSEITNFFLYKIEINENLNKNKEEIIGHFFKEHIDKLESITFKFDFDKNEKHNSGKSALKVDVFDGDSKIGSIYYKPRSARVDKLVIDKFKKINKFNQAKIKENSDELDRLRKKIDKQGISKSFQVVKGERPNIKIEIQKKESAIEELKEKLLPEYKIVNFNEEKENSFSIWEFVDGEKISKTIEHPNEYIVRSDLTDDQKDKAAKSLARLELVLGKMNITDLHAENVIVLKKDDGVMVVPIDIEVWQPGEKTQLYGKTNFFKPPPKAPPLTPDESKIINEFNQEIKNEKIIVRALIVGTRALCINLSHKAYEQIVKLIKKQSVELGIELKVKDEILTKLVLIDIINGDVPFFTRRGDDLFYGTDKETPIGKFKEKKKE